MKISLRTIKEKLKALAWASRFHCRVLFSGKQPRLFYLMGLGEKFPNLGDQAQAAAIPIWLNKHVDMQIIELKNFEIETCLPLLKTKIRNDDIVVLHSGGNFGDDWYGTQQSRESIISALAENKIIQLPQTIFYSDTDKGHLAVDRSRQVINAHPDLLIFGRDFKSTEIARKLFDRAAVLSRPDMVLSLQEIVESELGDALVKRSARIKKVLLIMRNDKEGVYDQEGKKYIANMLADEGFDVQLWDTDVHDTFPDRKKFRTLSKYLKFISGFDAVITDRYHGLIFTVLVKRPCIVLRTHNHKLTSAFDWFDEVNYVKRIDSMGELIPAIRKFDALDKYLAPNWNAKHFDPMAVELKKFMSTNNSRLTNV